MGVTIAFWVLAVVSVLSSLAVVLFRDVFKGALFLVLSFLGVAGIYVTLQADFLAAVQVLVYAGAISILIIFAVMLTRNVSQGSRANHLTPYAVVVALVLLVLIITAILGTSWPQRPEVTGELAMGSTGPLADVLFNRYLLPFEVASVLLLAALIGAIAIAREK